MSNRLSARIIRALRYEAPAGYTIDGLIDIVGADREAIQRAIDKPLEDGRIVRRSEFLFLGKGKSNG